MFTIASVVLYVSTEDTYGEKGNTSYTIKGVCDIFGGKMGCVGKVTLVGCLR